MSEKTKELLERWQRQCLVEGLRPMILICAGLRSDDGEVCIVVNSAAPPDITRSTLAKCAQATSQGGQP